MLIRALSVVIAAGACLPVICAGPGKQLQSASDALTWAPPDLHEPVIVHATEAKHSFSLDPARDYIVDIGGTESNRVDVGSGTLTISGGRNVAVIGGEVHAPGSGRSIMLRSQTGTMHFEGIRITGAGLREGFNIDQRRGGVVQIQNVIVDEVAGSRAGHHADVLQTWAGPGILRIDRLDGTTNYQGMMLQPFQFDGDTPVEWHFKRMVPRMPSGGGYTIYKADREDLRSARKTSPSSIRRRTCPS